MQPGHLPPNLPWFLRAEHQPGLVRLAVCLAFVVVTLLSIWRVVRTLDMPGTPSERTQGLIDFHNAVYFPSLAYGEGYNPYGQAYAESYPVPRPLPLYSPAMFWLHYPFAMLPLRVANIAYFTLSFALVVALAASALAVCRVPLTLANVLGLATLVLVSRPGHINLMLGQVTLPTVLGAIWALELARRRPILSGVALALTTLKPTFGVPLVWLMFCRRDFRAVIAGILIGAAAALAGAAPIIAREGFSAFLESLRGSQTLHEDDPIVAAETSWTRIDTLALVGKLSPETAQAAVELSVTAICLLAAGWAVWRTARTPLGDGADNLSGLIICTATLACIYHSTYDALLLVVPWVGAAVGRLRDQLPKGLRVVMWLLLSVPAMNYLSSREFTRLFAVEGGLWTAFTLLNSACIFAALALSIGVALRTGAWGNAPVRQ